MGDIRRNIYEISVEIRRISLTAYIRWEIAKEISKIPTQIYYHIMTVWILCHLHDIVNVYTRKNKQDYTVYNSFDKSLSCT